MIDAQWALRDREQDALNIRRLTAWSVRVSQSNLIYPVGITKMVVRWPWQEAA